MLSDQRLAEHLFFQLPAANPFGWELTAETEGRMRAFLAENPKDKHGAHIYSLDDFGLTREAIDTRFHRYIDYLETL